MSNVDRKAGPGGGPGDIAAASLVEADAGRPGGPGDSAVYADAGPPGGPGDAALDEALEEAED
jgi:hypothetical protein